MQLWIEDVPPYIIKDDAVFGVKDGIRKCGKKVAEKKIGDYTLFLICCFDKYEDGYCVFACNNDKFNGYYVTTWDIVADVQYRGNSDYPSKYSNKYAGKKTFESITNISDFEKVKDNCYYFLER